MKTSILHLDEHLKRSGIPRHRRVASLRRLSVSIESMSSSRNMSVRRLLSERRKIHLKMPVSHTPSVAASCLLVL